MCVMLYAKILKMKTTKQVCFFYFVISGISIEGAGPMGHLPGYVYDFEIRTPL